MGQHLSNWIYGPSVDLPTDSQLYNDRMQDNDTVDNSFCPKIACCYNQHRIHK